MLWSVVINTISGASVSPFQLEMPQTLIDQNRHRIGTAPDTENFHRMDSFTSKFDFFKLEYTLKLRVLQARKMADMVCTHKLICSLH